MPLPSFVYVFKAVLHELALSADFLNSVQAPVDTDGANSPTSSWDQRANELFKALSKPAASVKDIPAVLDAIENFKGIGLDDRKLLLEDVLVLMSRLPPDSALSAKVQQYVISLLYNDLPHPPSGYAAEFNASRLSINAAPATRGGLPVTYAYRSADGSNYNPLAPSLGKAKSPYARSVPPTHVLPNHALPDPGLVFDQILRRREYVPHPGGISSLFFAFADLIIHCIFDTDYLNPTQNNASSYLDLSILYGSSDSDINQVRRKDGTGKLWDDVFSDARLLLMPPSTCALLVLFNRNHNYIAEKLLSINENGTYAWPPRTEEDRLIQDDEIFQRTRLINCGYFMNVILGDYVGAILGLVVDGTGWRLDPLMNMRESDHSISPRGKGNVVSIEFNLMYRWHATLSEQDAEWTKQEFQQFFGDKDPSKFTATDFIRTAHQALIPESDVKKRTFGGLQRQPDGRFKDEDLARIIQNATERRAAAYSSGCPEVLRVIEILGIEQSRSWGTCSLNEFRKFLGLKPYSTFSEWNPDPRIHTAAEALYSDIDNLELHVGLQAEECKEPGPGAGLCPGYTISRAILSDAVALTRGDPYLTTEFNTRNCTQWGYQDVQYDKDDGSYGGLLTKLLFRTLPNNYPIGSAYAHFPFLVPDYIREKNTEIGNNPRYIWERPHARSTDTVNVNTYYGARLFSIIPEELKDMSKTALIDGCVRVEKLISNPHSMGWVEYFQTETQNLIRDKSIKNFDNSNTVDIVRDVINLLPVHWIGEQILGLPLKTKSNPWGSIYERNAYKDFAALGRYVFSNVDPGDDWHLRSDSEKAFRELLGYAKGRLDEINNRVSFSFVQTAVVDSISVESTEDSVRFAAQVIAEFEEPRPTNAELAAYVVTALVPTTAYFSQAIAHVIDFYLAEEREEERAEIVRLSDSINNVNMSRIMTYVHKALHDFNGLAPVSLGIGLLSPSFFESTAPIIVGTILGLEKIRRSTGNGGRLPQFKEECNGITRQLYIDEKGKVTPFPPSLKINFDDLV